jgi:integrase
MSATYATKMAATTVTAWLNLIVSDNENGVELPKSKKSRRPLDTARELAHELKLWTLRCPPSDHDLAFTRLATDSSIGKTPVRFSNRIIEQANEKRQEQDDVKRLTFYRLRHTFASLLLSKGKDITEVSR